MNFSVLVRGRCARGAQIGAIASVAPLVKILGELLKKDIDKKDFKY
jgi:hypothetical protein